MRELQRGARIGICGLKIHRTKKGQIDFLRLDTLYSEGSLYIQLKIKRKSHKSTHNRVLYEAFLKCYN